MEKSNNISPNLNNKMTFLEDNMEIVFTTWKKENILKIKVNKSSYIKMKNFCWSKE
jgi:hypothetical protein